MKRISALPLIWALCFAGPVHSAASCASTLATGAVSTFLEDRDLEHQVARQSDPRLTHPDEACGHVCAVNLDQSLSLALGKPLIVDPTARLNEMLRLPEWQHGLDQVRLNSFLYILFAKGSIDVAALRWEPEAGIADGIDLTPRIGSGDLKVGVHTGQFIQMLPYVPHQGFKRSAHWVLLSKLNPTGSTAVISDPNFPRVPVIMRVDRLSLPDGDMHSLRLIPNEPEIQALYDRHYGPGVFFAVKALTTISSRENP